jgi:hypothetical protein
MASDENDRVLREQLSRWLEENYGWKVSMFNVALAAGERWNDQANLHRRAAIDTATRELHFPERPWDEKAHLAFARMYDEKALAMQDMALRLGTP